MRRREFIFGLIAQLHIATNGDGGMELLKTLIVGDTPLNQLLDA